MIVAISRGITNPTLSQLYERLESVVRRWANSQNVEGDVCMVRRRPEHSTEIDGLLRNEPFNEATVDESMKNCSFEGRR